MNTEVQLPDPWPTTATERPDAGWLVQWADAARGGADGEVTVRVVDEAESAQLNQRFRGKSGPTNVLSFPYDEPELLGDVAICAAVVEREASEQAKPVIHHWAHMVVHGVLHLRGYDHIDETDAARMEAEEVRLLAGFAIPDPYQSTEEETRA